MSFSPSQLLIATSTWLRTRRSRCLFLLFFSPILLPFLCVTFSLLCAAELCIHVCGLRRKKKDEDRGDRLRRCEEGFCECDCEEEEEKEVGLLQWYLEDRLRLVGYVYECGDGFDYHDDDEDNEGGQKDYHDYNLNIPLLETVISVSWNI